MRKPNGPHLLLASGLTLWLGCGAVLLAQYSEQPQAPVTTIPESGPNRPVGEAAPVPRPRAPQPPADAEKPTPDRLDPDQAPTFRSDVELVNISVVVQDKDGNFVPGLKKENFRLAEDNVPQTLQRVETGEATVTVAMVVEYSSSYWDFQQDIIQASFGFVQSLKPEDWVAVIFYDLQTRIELDFTRNKNAVMGTLAGLQTPGFSESNLFDAVADVVGRMQDVEGKKAIVLIGTGVDTFSKTHLNQVLDVVKASDTPIYAIGTGQGARLYYEGRGYMSDEASLTFLQADNQLRSFARYSGGRAYFPRFEGQFPSIYADISAALRNEYVLSYAPTNTAHDGKFRKVKVELVDAAGKPLKIVDQKGKEIKYEIRAREGYTAPRAVE
jgi:VWFA-related protein